MVAFGEDGIVRSVDYATVERLKSFGLTQERIRAMTEFAKRNGQLYVDIPNCRGAGGDAWKKDHKNPETGVLRIGLNILEASL